jgi:hypothetical protein
MTPTPPQAACPLQQRAGHVINTTAAHWQLLNKEAS